MNRQEQAEMREKMKVKMKEKMKPRQGGIRQPDNTPFSSLVTEYQARVATNGLNRKKWNQTETYIFFFLFFF